MRYDILLSVHAMEEVVKLDLAISKKPVLLLSQTLQRGLGTEREKDRHVSSVVHRQNRTPGALKNRLESM